MSSTTTSARLVREPATAVRSRAVWERRRRQLGRSQFVLFLGLAAMCAGLTAISIALPRWTTPTMLVIPVLLGGSVLAMGYLGALALVAVAGLCVVLSVAGADAAGLGLLGIFVLMIGLILWSARVRSRLGVQGSRGESMLFDLRARLAAQGHLPELPTGWGSEVMYRSAHGDSFGGDFLVTSRSTDGNLLEVALVDVSGKGIDAGARSLLLSGAFGGILGSVEPERFLAAANNYLLRQHWEEGFATAIQFSLDLDSGVYSIFGAGHPPAAHFQAGSGQWTVVEPSGPALGLIEDATYDGMSGTLNPGDALLVYTDGLVETPDRDIAFGIDRLLGAADRLITEGFEEGARKLIRSVPDSESDDRALVLLWRS